VANLSGFPLQETSPQAEIERCLDRGKRANFSDELWPIRYMTGSDFVISYRIILTEMGIAMKRIVLAAAAAYLGCASFALSPSGEGRLVGLVQVVRNSPYGQP
jgi:hypothetical protein